MQTFYTFYCVDDPAHQALRETHLEAHLAHVEAHLDAYVLAGPLKAPNTDAVIGSLFILRGESLSAAQVVMDADPYMAGPLYASVTVTPMTGAAGSAVGGAAWKALLE
ncbi:MAG: YciI family protein [Pseudomonadota bacterium]